MNSCMGMTKEHDRLAAVLRDLERSGLSMAEFCRREDLPYSSVAAWRSAQRREAGRFIEVVSTGDSAMAARGGAAWPQPPEGAAKVRLKPEALEPERCGDRQPAGCPQATESTALSGIDLKGARRRPWYEDATAPA